MVYMLHFLKHFMLSFYFTSSDETEMVDWL